MTVGLLQLIIVIPGSNSLKDKRRVLLSLKDRLKKRYNISVAEVDYHDKWQKAAVAIAKVDKEHQMVDRAFNNIIEYVRNFNGLELIDSFAELF